MVRGTGNGFEGHGFEGHGFGGLGIWSGFFYFLNNYFLLDMWPRSSSLLPMFTIVLLSPPNTMV